MRSRCAGCGLLLGLLIQGCHRTPALPELPATTGDFVVLATGDPSGNLDGVRIDPVGKLDRAVPIHDGQLLFTWVLHPGDFVRWSSGHLGAIDLSEVAVSLASNTDGDRGSCQRCLTVPLAPPALVASGDSCPPPRFAPVRVYADQGGDLKLDPDLSSDALSRARLQLRLRWPGECAAVIPPAGDIPPTQTLCELLPAGAVGDNEFLLLTDSATVAGFNAYQTRLIEHGQTRIAEAQEQHGVRAWAELAPGLFLLVVYGESTATSRYELVGADLARLPVAGLPEDLAVAGVAVLEPGGPAVIFGGISHAGAYHPALYECTGLGTGEPGRCSGGELSTDPAHCVFTNASVLGVTRLPGNGLEIAATDAPSFFYRPAGATEWSCTPPFTPEYDFGGEHYRVAQFTPMQRIGDRVVVCGQTTTNGLGGGPAVVLTASFADLSAAATASISTAELTGRFKPVHRGDGYCEFAARLPPGDRMLLGTKGGVLEFTEASEVAVGAYSPLGVPGTRSLFPEIGQPIDSLIGNPSSSALLVRTVEGALFLQQGQQPLQRIAGPQSYDPSPFNAVLAHGQELIALEGGGDLRRVSRDPATPGCSGVKMSSIALNSEDRARLLGLGAATIDLGAPDTLLLVGTASSVGNVPWLRALSLATARITSTHSFPELTGKTILDLVSLAPSAALLVTVEQLYLFRDGAITPIEEQRIDPDALPSALPPPRGLWTAAGAAGGMAWVVGSDKLGRIVPGPNDTLIVESFWLDRLRNADGFDSISRKGPEQLVSIRVLAPDRATFAVVEQAFLDIKGSAWELLAKDVERFDLLRYPNSEGPLADCSFPQSVAGARDPLAFTCSLGDVTWASQNVALPIQELTVGAAIDGLLLIGGRQGRLAAVLKP